MPDPTPPFSDNRAQPMVRRSADPDELAERVAAHLISRLARIQQHGRVPSIALTGGSIAVKIHETVAESPDRHLVDWGHVDFWFGDERFVPAADPERNARQARTAMLDHLPVDPARVHEMPAADGSHAGDLDAAAEAYGQEIRRQGSGEFDVVMLGIGEDGHVASLFPGFPQLDIDDAIAVAVRDSPKPPPERVSLTFSALERTRDLWFVASGAGKAEGVRRALDPDTDVHEVPASRPRGRQRTLWFLDEESASQL